MDRGIFRDGTEDEYVLTTLKSHLKTGGAILMALYNDEVAGTVALRKVDSVTYEFTKDGR